MDIPSALGSSRSLVGCDDEMRVSSLLLVSVPVASSFHSYRCYTCQRTTPLTSIHLVEIDEDDCRRIANRGVMAREFEAAVLTTHLKDGDVVGSLIAAIEELARRVEVEAARIIPSCPFFPDEGEIAVWANGEDPDAVMQPVARIDESSIA